MTKTYLGETPVNMRQHFTYSRYTPTDWALYFIEQYGQIDGGHHKQWVIDQIARILKGTPIVGVVVSWSDGSIEYRFSTGDPSTQYKAWVREMLGEEIDGEFEYNYDEGIVP